MIRESMAAINGIIANDDSKVGNHLPVTDD
jgi:hypothetical protein